MTHHGAMAGVVEVRGLTKRFGRGVVAVDRLDFAVDAGTVCGLLGPNGAGKTTTLRILLGLVHPSAGEARLFGERVRPGMPVLTRVGSMIEEAAFAPYLTGLANLRLYWQAGGDAWEDADVDSALAVAGLGDAVGRRVKTYSHGMRQRLGLARMLLGRPDVLVLDEPTNGLDPQEIREFRRLIRRLADSGATVLLSSHLLAEVEQVCSHAVVMDRGRLVAAGSVRELVRGARSVYIEVDDGDAAARVLGEMTGVRAVTADPPGLTLELDGTPRSEVVAALVHAGVGVETVMARNRLEDAFLGLVAEDGGGD